MGCNWAFKSPSFFLPVPKGMKSMFNIMLAIIRGLVITVGFVAAALSTPSVLAQTSRTFQFSARDDITSAQGAGRFDTTGSATGVGVFALSEGATKVFRVRFSLVDLYGTPTLSGTVTSSRLPFISVGDAVRVTLVDRPDADVVIVEVFVSPETGFVYERSYFECLGDQVTVAINPEID